MIDAIYAQLADDRRRELQAAAAAYRLARQARRQATGGREATPAPCSVRPAGQERDLLKATL